MSGVLIALEVLVGVLLVLCPVFVVITLVRRRLIAQDAELALCTLAVAGERPRVGMMRMTVDTLEWYRLFGVMPRTDHRWPRRGLEVDVPRAVDDDTIASGMLRAGVRVAVDARRGGRDESLDLVMTGSSYTAFRAWVEAAPPSLPVSS